MASFWFDPWVNRMVLRDLFPNLSFLEAGIERDVKVADVWENGEWILPSLMTADMAHAWSLVRSVQFLFGQDDEIRWNYNASGKYSISFRYDAIRNRREKVFWRDLFWSKVVYSRLIFILWLAANNRLAVKQRLFSWGISLNLSCCFCGDFQESLATFVL
ncbi:uncharacterized protein [Rutidosis leptorrhynchoides]|uniref:uncharacterized protein n=1 Tax=Rutidosis leptorrhynchoides TaxID=125765 RepID=UPI003A9A58E0